MYERKICANCNVPIPIDVPIYMANDKCFCTTHCRVGYFKRNKTMNVATTTKSTSLRSCSWSFEWLFPIKK